MKTISRLLPAALLMLGLAAQAAAPASSPGCCSQAPGADALRAKHAQLAANLASNPYGRPLHVESRESENALRGEVYAVMSRPFALVRESLAGSRSWCEVMLLPFNTKGCTAQADALQLYVGRKYDTAIENATRIDFHYALKSQTDDFLLVVLDAPHGPLGTHDYRIALEAAPLEDGRTFLHLSYSYGFGAMSRMAMSTYLATAGSEKVGFSSVKDDQGRPQLVRGVRGVVERNTMRYFLAIDAFLDSLSTPAEARVDRRLRTWFESTQRYPQQLHEMDYEQYVAMKRREYSKLAAR